jgi:hypothetical protein
VLRRQAAAKDAQDELGHGDSKAQPSLCNVLGHRTTANLAFLGAELLPHQARHPLLAARERELVVVIFEVV